MGAGYCSKPQQCIQQKAGSKQPRLCSAGREDMDVKMLGSGRPFVLQCINPRMSNITPEALAEVQRQIAAVSMFAQSILPLEMVAWACRW